MKYQFNGKNFTPVTVKTTDTKTKEVINYKGHKKSKTTKKYIFISLLVKDDLYVVDKHGFESTDDYRGLLDLFKDLFLV